MGVIKFRVAICGAGIGGLAHACALAKYSDISVNIYESTAKFSSPFGAGIGMWPRAWSILCALGLGEDLMKITSGSPTNGIVHSFSFRKSDQSTGFTFGNMFSRGPLLTFHRAQFQQVLAEHLPSSCRIHYSKRLKSYSQGPCDDDGKRGGGGGGPIRLSFEDGTYATCDILVGADGIKSAVRKCLLREQLRVESEAITRNFRNRNGDSDSGGQQLTDTDTDTRQNLVVAVPGASCLNKDYKDYKDYVAWAGSIAYRALIPVERLQGDCDEGLLVIPTTPTMYVGKDVHMIVYPVSKGQVINLVLFRFQPELEGMPYRGPWSEEVDESELFDIARFQHWEPDVGRWLKHVRKPTKWAIHTVVDLPTFISGRAVLIGDAAHSCSPYQGTGAGQAIEDAYFLAELLGDSRTTLPTLSQALKLYDKFRRPWTQETGAKAMANGRYFTLHYDGFDFVNADPGAVVEKLSELTDVMVEGWKWCWTTTVEESLREALVQLDEVI